jgi:hypothetical protein
MGASNLDNVIKFRPLFVKRSVEFLEARQEPLVNLQGHRNMHCSGESVIGALASINVVIGVNWGFGAKLSTQNLNRPGEQVYSLLVQDISLSPLPLSPSFLPFSLFFLPLSLPSPSLPTAPLPSSQEQHKEHSDGYKQ